MTCLSCESKHDCTAIAIVASLIIGIIAAFLQITAVIKITPVFLLVAFGIAIVYLAVILVVTSLAQHPIACNGRCSTLSALLAGILGTILFAIILLAISFAATSIIGAIILGVLVFFFSLMVTTTACLARCLVNCNN